MDKQEYRLKTEQMVKLLKNKSYQEAYDIAESIDWRKVKNTSVLCAVSEVYEACGEIQKSRDILFMAYDRVPESKKIVYRLGTLALKLGELKEASDCYEEFLLLAPKDPNRFVFKYKLLKSKGAPLEEQIAVLEEFKQVEYVEKWAFELAKLYHEAGMISECLEECDDLILWFNEGKYIYKAMEMKMQYKPLTPLQHEKYMSRFEEKTEKVEDVIKKSMEEIGADVSAVNEEKQEELKEEVQKIVASKEQKEAVEETEAKEEVQEEVAPEKPSATIEEMLQEWKAQQEENAQMIQAELARVEEEKAKQMEEAPEEEEQEEILSDDVRKLMEELEAESAEISAQKTVAEEQPIMQKVVEQLSIHEEETPEEVDEVLDTIEEIEEPEEEGIKLGDTQSMALAAKALASAALVSAPIIEPAIEETVPEEELVRPVTPFDTGFVVQGRYDLEAQSAVGTQAGLTEEQKKLFSYFVPVHGMSEQLVKVLQDDKKCKSRYGTSRIGNIVVVGRRGSGKTVLAVDIVKAIQKARRMKQGKVAIVKAESLNKKDIREIVDKLHGGALVIERASKLQRNTIEHLCNVMEGQTGELLVVLEDERKPLDRMMAEHPNLKKKFTSRVELPVFINDELVTFGQTYAKENGYKIDEMGILALYSDIDVLQREEKVVTVADVKAIIDDAIENANRPSLKKTIKKLFGKRKDESNRIILKEEDFR